MELKEQIANNIIYYRKEYGLTQAELAERLNYSDKAVSKWERGESLPDICTLVAIAEIFDITVNDLISQQKRVRKRKPLNVILSTGIVWLVATALFVILNMLPIEFFRTWLLFVYAVPATAIVLIVFFAIWHDRLLILLAESLLIWSLAVSVFLTLLNYSANFYIFFLPIPLQFLAIFWFLRRNKPKYKKNHTKNENSDNENIE